jgi:hypothetical protein
VTDVVQKVAIDVDVPISRKSSIFLERMVSSMFMRVNAKLSTRCANHPAVRVLGSARSGPARFSRSGLFLAYGAVSLVHG